MIRQHPDRRVPPAVDFGGMDEEATPDSPAGDDAGPAPSLDELAGQLAGVERALERLEDGTYWVDELTGEPIPEDVLVDDPTTRRAAPPSGDPSA